MEAVASLKAEQLRQWREERVSEARFLRHTTAVMADLAAFLDRPHDPAARARVVGWLEPIRGRNRYSAVNVFDGAGTIVLSIPASAGHPAALPPGALPRDTAQIAFTDLERDRDTGILSLSLIVPIPRAQDGSLLGGVELRIDPETYLFPVLQQWPSPSETAEILLVRREGDEVHFLSRLRHRTDLPLSVHLPVDNPDLPAARAARGEWATDEGLDYRGVPVLAAGRPIPDSPWLLIAKMDQGEIYAPQVVEAVRTGLLVLILLLAVTLGSIAVWRNRRASYLAYLLAAEREQAALARRLSAVMNHANDCIMLLDEEGRILEANSRTIATYGYPLEELRALPPGALRESVDRAQLDNQLRIFESPEGGRFETVHRRKDGSTFSVEISAGPVEIDGRHLKLGIYRDITQRKEHEAQIERLSRCYAALSQINNAIVHTTTREQLFAEICRVLVQAGRFRMAWIGWLDPAGAEVLPVAQAGDDGYLAGIAIRTDDRPEGRGPSGTAIREGRTCVCNDFASDPETTPWRERAVRHGFRSSAALPIRHGGRVGGALSLYASEPHAFGEKEIALLEEAASDVSFALDLIDRETNRRQIEALLRREQDLFASLAGTIPDHIYFKDLQCQFVRINESMARSCGLPPAEAVGKTDFDIFDAPHARKAHADDLHVLSTGQSIVDSEERSVWPDGRITWVSTTKVPLRDPAGHITGLVGITRDITTRKAAERRIREQAELLDKASEAIVVIDLQDRITFWNRGAEKLFGFAAAERLGRPIGQTLSLATVASQAAIREGLSTQDIWRGEVQGADRHGRPRTIEISITLVHDDAGQPVARLCISTDITERRRLQEQFMRAQRLESIGMLAAGIAHDLNNVLAPIVMSVPLLREHATDARDRRMLDTVEKSASRGSGLVRQILGFVHGIGGEPRSVQAKHLLRDIAEVIQATFPKSVRLLHDTPADLWPIRANPTQIHQVLLNLCVNARDAMPEGGTLVLRGENLTLDDTAAAKLDGARPGRWLVLHVQDSGTGIPAEIQAQIWDPFFTTKAVGKGTGLGLSTVRGIVANHRGFIQLETVPERGTTFRIHLPADESAIKETGSVPPFPSARGSGELILVVDDEPSIRDVTHSILTQTGYQVVATGDGAEAVESFSSRVAEIRLLVTDLLMPDVGGVSLIELVRRLNPRIKILVISGSDDAPQTLAKIDPPVQGFLAKPFTVQQLLEEVKRLLTLPDRTT